MLATKAQALELSMVFSQSLARRRHRPSQASVRSTTHLRGNTSNPWAVSDRLMIALDDRDGPVTMTLEGITQFAARIAAIGEDVAQPGKAVADGLEQRRCSVAILHIGRMNKDEEHDAKRVIRTPAEGVGRDSRWLGLRID